MWVMASDPFDHRTPEERALMAALAALAPAEEAAAPAWADVLRRAAALPVCHCRARGVDPTGACAAIVPARP